VGFTMELFQKGRLLGEEVTMLLGKNPGFSVQVLSNSEQSHAGSIQIMELKRRYPIEINMISAGLFVNTPLGWAKITAIEDQSGKHLSYISPDEKSAKLKLAINTRNPQFDGILDMQSNHLTLLGSPVLFQCGKCKFISSDQNFILREHTRQFHDGIGPSVRRIPSEMNILTELEFRKEIS
jgi:hypothetical protein